MTADRPHEPPVDRIGEPAAYVQRTREDLVETLLALLSYDTQNPPAETRALFRWLDDEFGELDIETACVDAGAGVEIDPDTAPADGPPVLVATLPGVSDWTLLLEGHLDTVPYDADEWTYDPLGERVTAGDDDRIYGRGATDMKASVAAMLWTARAYVATETEPPVSLQFAFVGDEETGGDGIAPLLDDGTLDPDGCVIGEPTCEEGRHSVTVADRGSIWLTLDATGTAAHGSRPVLGENAIDRLYAAITAVRESLAAYRLDLPAAVEPIVEESVEYYGPSMGTAVARELFSYPSVNLGVLEGGSAVNTVPATATARLDVRVAPGVHTPDVLEAVRATVDDHDGVSIAAADWSIGSYTALDEPLVESVVAIAGDVTGERVFRRSATGGGDAKTLRHAGVPTVEFALGTDTVHAVDEYTTVGALEGNALTYTRLPAALADRLA